jgi:hypothetical protein
MRGITERISETRQMIVDRQHPSGGLLNPDTEVCHDLTAST